MKLATILAAAMALASPAAATTWTYDLENYIGETGVTKSLGLEPGSWGFAMWPRHPTEALLFDLNDPGKDRVQLAYDDVGQTARLWGPMTEIFSGKDAFIDISMDQLTGVGPGQFVDTVGNGIGTLSWGDQIRSIYADGMDGFFFGFTCDSHRFTPTMIEEHGDKVCGAHGWFSMAGYTGAGVRDIVATARLQTPPSPVPLPAGVILLAAAIGALGAVRRRA